MTTSPANFSRSSENPSMDLSHTRKFRSFKKALFLSLLFFLFVLFSYSLAFFFPVAVYYGLHGVKTLMPLQSKKNIMCSNESSVISKSIVNEQQKCYLLMLLRQKSILFKALKQLWSRRVQIHPIIVLVWGKKVIGLSAEKARKDNYFMLQSVTFK